MRSSLLSRGLLAGGAVAALVVAGCSGGSSGGDGEGSAKQNLAPQFPPESAAERGASTTSPSGSAPTGASEPGRGAGPGVQTTTSAPSVAGTDGGPTGGSVGTSSSEASIRDGEGDVTPSPADPPPAWADLLGGRLIRTPSGFELRVRLGGGAAPQRTPDADHTMNIASFYDLDGDGRIDTEVWLNVAASGWAATWFDNVGDGGGFQEGSGVKVTPEGDEVVARFPLSHLGAAEQFRWALASEWGRYETIGTVAAARDDLPDNDNVAAFPGS